MTSAVGWLDEIREREQTASPPTWVTFCPAKKALQIQAGNQLICIMGGNTKGIGRANTEFIAHARTDVPHLLAAIKFLQIEALHGAQTRAELDRIDGALKAGTFPRGPNA